MKNLITLLISTLMITPAMATEMPAAEAKPPKKMKPLRACKKMNLSDAQKAEAKEAREMFRMETAELREKLQKVRKRYRKAVANVEVPAKRANKLARRRNRLAKRMRDARSALQHNLIYEIGTDEQRPQILKCLKARKKRMLRRRLRRLNGKKKGKEMPKA